MEALSAQVEALSRQNPVLMIFEDAHWADPTSLEAFSRTVDRIRTLPVLLLVTFRPEFEPPWIGRPYVTALIINRLAERDVSAMIDRVIGNKLLSPSIQENIIERSDGIPLFVEEMTKAVLEAGIDGAAEQIAAVPSPTTAVPASLHASLMARLDRLGTAKEVAQVGSAIGREFSYALLAAVARKPDVELQSALDRLIGAGLLFRQGMPPHATYLFKHALVQDAAYGTLLREPRRALHARIADTLESEFIDVAESQPELVARHCTEASLPEKAALLWGKAGQRSLRRSALVEGAEQLRRGLDQIASLPGTPALRREQIRLQVALANALMHTKGYAAPVSKAAVEQAHLLIEQAKALGEPPEDRLLPFSVLYGFFVGSFVAFNADGCLKFATQFLTLAEKQGAAAPLMIGHRLTGCALVHGGDIAKGRAHLDRAIGLYDPTKHRELATRFGQDARAAAWSYRALTLWLLGRPEAALTDVENAIKDARDTSHAATLLYALTCTNLTQIACGNYEAVRAQSDEAIALADEKGGTPFWRAHATIELGCLLTFTGKAADATRVITAGLDAYRSTGATMYLPWHLSSLASAHANLGQLNDAWRCIREAMTMIETAKERVWEAEVNRVGGQIVLKSTEPDQTMAQSYFEHALEIARQQQTKSWELRASMSLTRLWRDQGKVQQARELLAPVYGWFTEGFDTRDLKEAKALLDELHA